MKTLLTSIVAGLAVVCLTACEGPEGPAGPQGTQGVAGPQGTTGPQGPMGNANVTYSEWKPVPLDGGMFRSADNLYVSLYPRSTAHPMLTKDAIDKGLIYVYFKFGQLQWDQTNAEYRLVERINAGFSNGYVKVSGRATNNWEDYVQYQVLNDHLGENYFYPQVYLLTRQWDNAQRKEVPIPDLTGKPAQFYRDMLKDLPQFRIVVVNGSVKGGRQAAVDFTDYAAVKKAFHLPD